MDEKNLLKKWRNIMSQYFYNIFTKILNDRLLLEITSKKKKKLSGGFKLKLITTYHLKVIVKIL